MKDQRVPVRLTKMTLVSFFRSALEGNTDVADEKENRPVICKEGMTRWVGMGKDWLSMTLPFPLTDS